MPVFLHSWTQWHYLAAFVLLLAGVAAVGTWIRRSDAELLAANTPRSAALEWKFSPPQAHAIVDAWDPPVEESKKQNLLWPATRGTLIDTFFFIPLYSTLFALCGFWCAAGLAPQSRWQVAYLALAWCGWVAGGLDLIENAGILAELRARWFFAAPATASAAYLKWAILVTSTVLVVGRAISALLAKWF